MENSVVCPIQFKTQLSIWQNTLNFGRLFKVLYLTHTSLNKEKRGWGIKSNPLCLLPNVMKCNETPDSPQAGCWPAICWLIAHLSSFGEWGDCLQTLRKFTPDPPLLSSVMPSAWNQLLSRRKALEYKQPISERAARRLDVGHMRVSAHLLWMRGESKAEPNEVFAVGHSALLPSLRDKGK